MRTVQRDWRRTERDDFVLNVAPYMNPTDGALLVGDVWVIKPLYE